MSKEHGGLAIFLQKLFKILKKEYNIHLILASSKNKVQKFQGIQIHHLNFNKLYFKILRRYFFFIYLALQSWIINNKVNLLIDKLKPKFVHFSNYQCLSLFYNNKLPSITRLSSLETMWSNSNYFSIIKFFEKLALKKTDLILSPSNFLIKELKKKYKLKSYFLPPLIENLSLKKKKIKRKVILTFGSISPGKGSYTIENSINNILKINDDIYYYWIGNVDKKFYKSNKEFEIKLKSKTSYPKRVKIFSKMNRNKLFQYLKQAEVVLLPSHRDNSPNVCLEALSLKKIVLARKNSGYDDLIKNNYNGFLFNDKKNDLIQRLVKILKISPKSKKKIEKNIKIKNKLFSNQRIKIFYKKYIQKIT